MINDTGGIAGHKIRFIALDDGYNPARTVELTRKLVEQENVLVMFDSIGTPTNAAVRKYLNDRGVPQLFVGSGATQWGDPAHYPWSMGWQPSYGAEARVFAAYIKANLPAAKVAILYQNDDYGKDYIAGLRAVFGADYDKRIVATASYEPTDATVDSQIISLAASGAGAFVNITSPKFAAQAIRKAYDIGWHPAQFLNSVSTGVAAVLTPAGLEKSVGLIAPGYFKDPTDPQFKGDKGVAEYAAWAAKYPPGSRPQELFAVYGYSVAQTMVQVLRQAGGDLTRANVLKQATDLKGLALPMLMPGITIDTSKTEYYPIHRMRLQRFDGTRWVPFGPVIEG